jgi:SAM-dependent methyltransferase
VPTDRRSACEMKRHSDAAPKHMVNEFTSLLDRDPGLNDDLALRNALPRVAEAFRRGSCPADHWFDRFLPNDLRALSGQYWTPLKAATRAAEWLDELKVRTVVDIGSGAGKFCVAAALAGRCHFTGLEQRSGLVAAARRLARTFDVDDRVAFVEGEFRITATPIADAYYLYNPFGEHIFGSTLLLETITCSGDRYARDVAAVEELLQRARVGTCLLTYNGFGGRVPADYRQIRVDETLPNARHLWRKKRSTSTTRGADQSATRIGIAPSD